MKKIIMAGVIVVATIMATGCDDDEEQKQALAQQQQQQQLWQQQQEQQNQAQQAPVIVQGQPSTVVVDGGGNGHSGPGMGEIIVGSAMGTMLGNHLSGNTGGQYRESNNRTTIINNHTNTHSYTEPAGRVTSQPISRGYNGSRAVTTYSSSRPSAGNSFTKKTTSYTSKTSTTKSFKSSRRR